MSRTGVMLSNGPGDPAENVEVIERNSKKLCDCKDPDHSASAWAISFWHWPTGRKTEKLKYGHRGANQPA